MDVWEHFATYDRDLAEQSAVWDDALYPYSAEAHAHDQRGMVYGRVVLTDKAFVSVHEVVQVDGSQASREKYGYFVMYDGEELYSEQRDFTHTPSSDAIALKDFLTKARDMVTSEDELRADT